MLSGADRTNMTATEVAERHEEKMLMLGPVLERLQNELIDPLIALTFAAIDEAGLVPPPPDELQGQPLNVVLLSILAQAQKAVGVNSIDRFVAAVSSVSQVKPEVLDVFDADAWAQYYADALGVEPKLLANPQAVQALREQRAQAQQVQQQAALATQLFGLAGQVAGSFYSARSQKTQARLQADLAEHNARMAEMGARQALFSGQRQAAARSLQAGQLLSAQKAAQAASGVDLSVGSAAELRAGTEIFKEADVNQIEANALMQAWGYRTQAGMARASSPSPSLAAGATLLTGAVSVADSWYRLQKSGALAGGGKPSENDDPIYGLYALNGGWKK